MEEERKKQGLSRRAFWGLGGTARSRVRPLPGWRAARRSGRRRGKASTAEAAADGTTGGMPVAESGASAGPDVAGMHSWGDRARRHPRGQDREHRGTATCS